MKSCKPSTALQLPRPHLFRATWSYPSLGHSAPSCNRHGQNTGGSMEKVLHIKWRNYSSQSTLEWLCSTFNIRLDREDDCHIAKPPTHLSHEDSGQLTNSISVFSYPKPNAEKQHKTKILKNPSSILFKLLFPSSFAFLSCLTSKKRGQMLMQSPVYVHVDAWHAPVTCFYGSCTVVPVLPQ